MPLIWAAISAHGFGHAAQVVPVLNAVGQRVPGLRIVLRTMVPPSFFIDRLTIPFDIQRAEQDVGCVQPNPLSIDIPATWQAYHQFHLSWEERLQTEVTAIQDARPDLILADAPYLAIEAGATARIPTVALMNFTWDLVLSAFPAPPNIPRQALLQAIRQAYAHADLALRITPAPVVNTFHRIFDIGPIADPASPAREQLAACLQLAPGERTVLIGFGGIPLTNLPFEFLHTLSGYRFLVDVPVPPDAHQFVPIHSLPLSFKELLASADLIMTKPGYGTVVEAVALGIPLIYIRRYNFADEQPLVEFLHRHGRGVELTQQDFVTGQWLAALEAATALPPPPIPAPCMNGAVDAAERLLPFLKHT
ncbi:MAG: hypothetical protein NNA18_08985 [Nitrospira sp.]|nr:hypothetical protein [Nitrospira sp.]